MPPTLELGVDRSVEGRTGTYQRDIPGTTETGDTEDGTKHAS